MKSKVIQPQKKFNPVTVELTFETQEELNWFYWVSNLSFAAAEEENGLCISPSEYGDAQIQLYRIAKELNERHSI